MDKPFRPRRRRSASEIIASRKQSASDNIQAPQKAESVGETEEAKEVSSSNKSVIAPKPLSGGVSRRTGKVRQLGPKPTHRNPESIVEPSYEEVFSEDQRDAYRKYVEPAMSNFRKARFDIESGIANYGTFNEYCLSSEKPPVVDKFPGQKWNNAFEVISEEGLKKCANEFSSNRLNPDDRKVVFEGKEYTIMDREFAVQMEDALDYLKYNNKAPRRVMKNVAANELVARGIDVKTPEDIIVGVPLVLNGNKINLPVYEEFYPERDDGPSM